MVVDHHALQEPHIIGIIRVAAGEFKLLDAAAGNLDPRVCGLQALHILGQFLGGEIPLDHGGQGKRFAFHNSGFTLVIHTGFLLICILAGI